MVLFYRNRRRGLVPLLVLLATSLLHGCSSEVPDDRPARTSVSGVVTHNGAAVEGATVTFRPSGEGGQGATGRTDADGAFEMGTFGAGDGVVPGTYNVVIDKFESAASAPALDPDDPNYDPNPPVVEDVPKNLLPEKYAAPETSGFTITVEADEDVTDLEYALSD